MKKWMSTLMLLLLAAVTFATTTYVVPGGSRFLDSHVGITAVDIAITAANQTVTVDPTMGGYLGRIVYSADGADTSFSITITDTNGCTLFSKTDCSAVGGPYTYVPTVTDTATNNYGGIPFLGGLSVALANCGDDGTTAVAIRLYVSESWRR